MRSKVRPNGKVYSIGEIADIVAPIAKEMGVERIYLFGSYARGCATPDSDVDLLVECGLIDSYFGIGKLYSRLNRALEKDLDIVPSDADQEFIDRIRPELVLVYGERSRCPQNNAGCGSGRRFGEPPTTGTRWESLRMLASLCGRDGSGLPVQSLMRPFFSE